MDLRKVSTTISITSFPHLTSTHHLTLSPHPFPQPSPHHLHPVSVFTPRYPCLSEVVKEYQIPEFDNLYLDMNGIIHNCSHPNDDDPHFRITEEKIIADIFHYIEVCQSLPSFTFPKPPPPPSPPPPPPPPGAVPDDPAEEGVLHGDRRRGAQGQDEPAEGQEVQVGNPHHLPSPHLTSPPLPSPSPHPRSAKEAELNEKKAKDRGEKLPEEER